jgi:hypothetical protein
MGVNPGLFISKTATMKKKTLLFLSALLFFTLFLKQAEAQISFSIKIIPPEPYYERPLPPSVNHVWIDGEWVPEGDHYRHKPGYWTVPEKDHIWVGGEWKLNPDGSSYWQPGYWKPIPHIGVGNWMPEPYYLRPPKPSPRHLWVEGDWIWQNNHYVYQTGYWVVPDPNKYFVKGHWAQWPDGEWYWIRGYWKRIPDNVYVSAPPPEPIYNRPPAPSPRHVWIDGEWVWNNNGFSWKPGYWILRDPHRNWVRGYWHQRQDGGWYWIGGHWDWI